MNKTNAEHAIYALLMQAAIGLLTGNWWIGASFGAAFFIGREIAQAERRWIKSYGNGKRENMPWWGRFDPRVWNKIDPWLDWICPVIAVVLLALIITLL